MNWKNRFKNYNFWISMFSAVLLILQALKIKFDVAYVNEIFTAVLGLLVVVGIIIDPTKTTVKVQEASASVQESSTTALEKEIESANTEQTLPFDNENETGDVDFQNDFQAFIAEIKTQINQTMEELKSLNQKNSISNPVVNAVAENSNPYVDVIN